MQDEHPIAFESRKLNKREQLKSTYDKEMLEIMQALEKGRKYLLGRKFMICTDHNSLQYLLQHKTLSTEQHKRIEKIVAFNMEIIHKKGTENVVTDALFIKYEDITSYSISVAILEWLNEI